MDQLSDYDYELDESLIAQEPLADRAASRLFLLHRESGKIEHRAFREVTEFLVPGDVLVLNDTRVTARRLFGHKESGAKVEALLLQPKSLTDYEAMLKPAKRLPAGAQIIFEGDRRAAVVAAGEGPLRTLRFDAPLNLDLVGETPVPPYITHKLKDEDRYQTVYADRTHPGSAAAPTAGLHFTGELLFELRSRGVELAYVTLDVGIDTFRPVQVESLDEHRMHGEKCSVSEEAAQTINSAPGRVVAVGTTSVRTLESFAREDGVLESGTKDTFAFIRPGYKFRCVDGMFTNFHLPRTTMLMMISALASFDSVRAAYAEAQAERYRFLSFGDSMLIL